jgi:hypothetical protein
MGFNDAASVPVSLSDDATYPHAQKHSRAEANSEAPPTPDNGTNRGPGATNEFRKQDWAIATNPVERIGHGA